MSEQILERPRPELTKSKARDASGWLPIGFQPVDQRPRPRPAIATIPKDDSTSTIGEDVFARHTQRTSFYSEHGLPPLFSPAGVRSPRLQSGGDTMPT